MAYYNNYDDRFQGDYNVGYSRPPYYERDSYRPSYDLALAPEGAFRQAPYYDTYRRDYHQGGAYDGRYGEGWRHRRGRGFAHGLRSLWHQVFGDSSHWMDQSRYRHGGHQGRYRSDRYDHYGGQGGGYRMDRYDHHGGQLGGYRMDRYDHHGGQDYGHGNYHHYGEDDHMRHGDHHSSRSAVELYVPICCDKCERKLRKHLDYIEGVENVTVDQETKKVVVFGHVNPSHVLRRARQDKPESDFWLPHYR